MSKDAARNKVRRAIAATGLTPTQFAKAEPTPLSPDTVTDFLSGDRWPQVRTLRAIEEKLGWDAGSIEDIAYRQDPPQPPLSVLGEAIRADPSLIPEAREPLARLYTLLLRPDPVIERARATIEQHEPAETRPNAGRGEPNGSVK